MKRKGLTLIELLISIVVFSLVMLAVFSVFFLQQKRTVYVRETSILQTDAQVAFNLLKQDIFHAGLGIPADRWPVNSINGGANAPDEITLFGVALGFELADARWNPVVERSINGSFRCRKMEAERNIVQNDTIIILSPNKELIWSNLTVQSVVPVFGTDDIIITVNNPSANSNAGCILYALEPNIYQNGIRYWINTAQNPPVLMRGEEIFLEGVEDIEFAYGLDMNADGVIDEANEFRNNIMDFGALIPGFSSSFLFDNKFVIRATMLVRTQAGTPDFKYPYASEVIEDRKIDFNAFERKYQRIVLTGLVSPRNIRR